MAFIRISGKMTVALAVYAFTFIRFSLAIRPRNYLLCGCHLVNAGAQSTQGARWFNWHYLGGKERAALLAKEAEEVAKPVKVVVVEKI